MQEAIREVTRRIESEGHVARVCGLFRALEESTCRAKTGKESDCNHIPSQPTVWEGLRGGLAGARGTGARNREKGEVQNNAYSMQEAAKNKKSPWRLPWA
ncbi:MAG TPA: hypothetical protein VJP87_10595, partial [Candidatus Acidoferrales bacterium]|nr:hypothetical protein [Candidatus Acidoferrales bacterium]